MAGRQERNEQRRTAAIEIFTSGQAKTVPGISAQLRARGIKMAPETVQRYLEDAEIVVDSMPGRKRRDRAARQSKVVEVYTSGQATNVPAITAQLRDEGIVINPETVWQYLANAEIVLPKHKRDRLTSEKKRALKQAITEGLTAGKKLEEIANEEGVSLSRVNRTLRAMGGRKGKKNPTQFPTLTPQEERARELVWQQTWTTVQRTGSKVHAAAELGISISTLNKHLTLLGVNFRESRKPQPKKAIVIFEAIKKTVREKTNQPSPQVAARYAFLLAIPADATLTIAQVVAQLNANLLPGEKRINKGMIYNDLHNLRKKGHTIHVRLPLPSERGSALRTVNSSTQRRRNAIQRLAGPNVTITELQEKLKASGVHLDREQIYYDINRLREQGVIVEAKWERDWAKGTPPKQTS